VIVKALLIPADAGLETIMVSQTTLLVSLFLAVLLADWFHQNHYHHQEMFYHFLLLKLSASFLSSITSLLISKI
jgi:hypothetical protein